MVASGAAWAMLATGVHLAVFSGFLPAPDELPLPLAVVLVVLDLPFLAALYLETAAGRSSPALPEVIALAIACGAAITLGFGWLGLRRPPGLP